VARTKERLREQDLDAIVVADPANMNYLTGYDGWSFYVHQAVVVTPDRDEPIWIGRDMDGDGARATTHLSDDSIRAYSDDHVHSPHDLHPMDYVAGVLDELDVVGRSDRIGDGRRLLHREVEVVHPAPGQPPGRRVRRRNAARRLDPCEEVGPRAGVHARGRSDLRERDACRADVIEEGVPEYEVAAEIYEQLIEGTMSTAATTPRSSH